MVPLTPWCQGARKTGHELPLDCVLDVFDGRLRHGRRSHSVPISTGLSPLDAFHPVRHDQGVDVQRRREAGHRILPHTADVIVESWGADRAACLEEAGRALVETFADVDDVLAPNGVTVTLSSTLDEDLLVELLEDVIFELDAHGAVPVEISLEATEEGGVAGFFDTAPVDDVVMVGAAPKGVSRSELEIGPDDGGWRCRAVIDV